MCSVIGYDPGQDNDGAEEMFAALMRESRVRGVHAFGVAQWVLGGPVITKSLDVEEIIAKFEPGVPTIAHCRYSTSGDWRSMANNQPIHVGNRALVFNGVIDMRRREEWDVECETENDGEIFLRRLAQGGSVEDILGESFSGSFAGLWFEDDGTMIAARNERRPLWYANPPNGVWYASTADILRRAGVTENMQEFPIV